MKRPGKTRAVFAAVLLAALLPGVLGAAGPDRFAAGWAAYHDGRSAVALEEFLALLAESPSHAKADEALRMVWQIAHEAKEAEAALTLPKERWDDAVRDAGNVMSRRHEDMEDLLARLERASHDIAIGTSPLSALRAGDVRLAVVNPAGLDEWARVRAEKELGDIRRALEKRLFQPFPDEADLQEATGYYWLYAGNFENAADAWRQSLSLRPDNASLKVRLGDIEARREAHARRDESERLFLLGLSDFKSGHYSDAARTFEKSVTLDPNAAEPRRYLDLAREAADGQKKTERVRALMLKGHEHFQASQWIEAVQCWVDILAIDPTHAAAREYLAKTRVRLARRSKTTAAPAAKAPAARPEEAEEAYTQGLLHYADGHMAEARASFERALSLRPSLDKARRALEQIKSETDAP